MLFLAISFLLLGFILLFHATRQRKAAGLPGGQIIYADTSNWIRVEKPLYDPKLGLSGKPDYLVKQKDTVIPVEVKSSRVTKAPYDSHIFQLAAYCHLVENEYKTRPEYGIIHYPNRTFRIENTSTLSDGLLDLLIDLRTKTNKLSVQRSHESSKRCARCGYSANCDQRLS
jgi:CRISPR-associated exonuclease Cas4